MSLRAAFEDILEVTEPVEDATMEEVQELAEELVEDSQDIEDTLTVVDTLEEEAEHVEVIQNAIEESDDLSEKEVLLHNVALEAISRRICLPTDRLYPAVESKQGLGSKAMDMLRRMYEAIKAALAKVWNSVVDFVSSTKKLADRIINVAKETKEKASKITAVNEFNVPGYTGHFTTKDGEVPTKETISKAKNMLINTVKATEQSFEAVAKLHADLSLAMNPASIIPGFTKSAFVFFPSDFKLPGKRSVSANMLTARIGFTGGAYKAAEGKISLTKSDITSICDDVIAVCKEVSDFVNDAKGRKTRTEATLKKINDDIRAEKGDSALLRGRLKLSELEGKYLAGSINGTPRLCLGIAKTMLQFANAGVRANEVA